MFSGWMMAEMSVKRQFLILSGKKFLYVGVSSTMGTYRPC